MADWGAVSSWVAAGISVTAFGAGTARAWWNRPQVDWAISGKMDWSGKMTETRLQGSGKVSNFGDGDAHRATVHVRRGAYLPGVLTTSPLLKPGDSLEFDLGVGADDYETTSIWVTWTSPPIRRHREKTSNRFAIDDHFIQTEVMKQRLDNRKKTVEMLERNVPQT